MSARLKPFGLGFARYAKSVALARGDALATQAFAEAKRIAWRDTPDVLTVAKAAVDAISSGGDGSGLAIARPLANGFLELVRPHSLVDRILGLRQVPANIAMLRVTGAAAAGWIGEGAPRQIGQFSFERETLLYDKLACTTVVTNELLHASGAIAEMVFAHELARGVAQFSDKAFIDPAFAAIPGVRPASISYGLTAISSSGATLAAVQADLKALFANFVAVDGALEREGGDDPRRLLARAFVHHLDKIRDVLLRQIFGDDLSGFAGNDREFIHGSLRCRPRRGASR